MITLDFMMFSVICFFFFWILSLIKEIEIHASFIRRESVILLSEQSFRLMNIEETLKKIVKDKETNNERR